MEILRREGKLQKLHYKEELHDFLFSNFLKNLMVKIGDFTCYVDGQPKEQLFCHSFMDL